MLYEAIIVVLVILLILVIWRNSSVVKVILFKKKTFPVCVKLDPEWIKTSQQLSWLSYNVSVIDLETSGFEELANNFSVTAVPVLWKVYPDGSRYQYQEDGDRTSDKLLNFVTQLPKPQVEGK